MIFCETNFLGILRKLLDKINLCSNLSRILVSQKIVILFDYINSVLIRNHQENGRLKIFQKSLSHTSVSFCKTKSFIFFKKIRHSTDMKCKIDLSPCQGG